MTKNQLKRCQIAKIWLLLQEVDFAENDDSNKFGSEIEIVPFLWICKEKKPKQQ